MQTVTENHTGQELIFKGIAYFTFTGIIIRVFYRILVAETNPILTS